MDEGAGIVTGAALRHLVQCVVEPSTDPLPTVQLENVESGTARLIGDLETLPTAGQNRFRPGDVLFSKLRPYLAKSLRVTDDFQGSGEFLCLRPSGDLDGRYLTFLSLSRAWLDHAMMSAYGTKMPRTSWENLAGFRVPDLGIDQQRRIADFLDDRVARIDRIIAARREQAELTELMVRSVIGRLLDDCLSTYGGSPLRRFARGIEQGSSPVGEDKPAGTDECGLLKTSAISAGIFHPERNKTIDPANADERYSVQDGDLVVTRGSGSADLVGDAAVAVVSDYPGRLFLSDLTYRVRDLEIDPEFAALALLSPRGRSELGARVRQGSGPAKARGDDILSITVPSAPRMEQRSLVAKWHIARADIATAREGMVTSIDLLGEYKSSLITAAVTGELDVTTAGSGIPA